MSEEKDKEVPVCESAGPITCRTKRDLFRFAGEKPTAINLEHVTQIILDGKRITFHFYSTAMYVDLENEAAAASVFEVVLNLWAGEVK